jgi:hypothetical protein|tara:strand:- start:551 stop:754 length:204 start_codon:yes stop_codon:yes gene_type:complete
MKKYKIRIAGLGIEATAMIPFNVEPTLTEVEQKTAEYLNHNLMKIEKNDFYATDRYFMTYEEIPIEL